jgi:hypothetical protein
LLDLVVILESHQNRLLGHRHEVESPAVTSASAL